RQREEMIVVHPDDVVWPQNLVQFIGEMLVDAQIAAEVTAREFRKIEPVMQDRPQHAVGEAVVIFVVIFLRQIGDDIGNLVGLDGLGLQALVGNASAPAEPDAWMFLQRRQYSDLKPPGAAARARNRN